MLWFRSELGTDRMSSGKMAAAFDLECLVESCWKTDLVQTANHLTSQLQALVVGELVEMEVLVFQAPAKSAGRDVGVLSEEVIGQRVEEPQTVDLREDEEIQGGNSVHAFSIAPL